MTHARMAGLVFAGGESQRMGVADKPLLLIGGRPMLAWVIEALALEDIAISANGDPARFSPFGRTVLADGAYAGQGPLAGLLAGLDWAASLGAETLLTAPGDTPFLPSGLGILLAPAPGAVESGGRRHHLIALWPVAGRTMLRAILSVPGPRRVEMFAARIGMRYVSLPARTPDVFANINTPSDLQAARLWVNGSHPAAPGGSDQGRGA